MTETILPIVLIVVTLVNVGSVIAVGTIVKNYGILTEKVENLTEAFDEKGYGELVGKVKEHDQILHDGIIDELEKIGKKVESFGKCPDKIDSLIKEHSELKGKIDMYIKIKS